MICLEVKILKSFKDKVTGLINSKNAFSVLFKTRFGVHTFGLRFPIDVLVLDRENKVVKMSINLKQNRFFMWHPKFDTVIELPQGQIKTNNIKLGDIIKIKVID